MSDVRVVSWNVLYHDLPIRADGLCRVIAKAKPDIVLLQETNPENAAFVSDQLGMALLGCGPRASGQPFHSAPAILARDADAPAKECLVLADEDKVYAILTTYAVGSSEVLVGSVHLTHTNHVGRISLDPDYVAAAQCLASVEAIRDDSIRLSVQARLRQLNALLDAVVNRTVVLLGGDFNFVPHGVEYRHLLTAGYGDCWDAGPRLGSRDTVLEQNPLIASGPGAYTPIARSAMPGTTGPLDYTLDFQFTKGLHGVAAWVLGRPDPDAPVWHSDHLGLAADYDIDSRVSNQQASD